MIRRRYEDAMARIDEKGITLKRFFVFSMGSVRIDYDEIRTLRVQKLGLVLGKLRLQGTTDLRTWWPLDWGRPARRFAFILEKNRAWPLIGFTVADFDAALAMFRMHLGSRLDESALAGEPKREGPKKKTSTPRRRVPVRSTSAPRESITNA